jgi:hypothetical protein
MRALQVFGGAACIRAGISSEKSSISRSGMGQFSRRFGQASGAG